MAFPLTDSAAFNAANDYYDRVGPADGWDPDAAREEAEEAEHATRWRWRAESRARFLHKTGRRPHGWTGRSVLALPY